jgi:hypothetical protein
MGVSPTTDDERSEEHLNGYWALNPGCSCWWFACPAPIYVWGHTIFCPRGRSTITMNHLRFFSLLAALVAASSITCAQSQVPTSREPGARQGVHSPRHAKAVKRRKQKVQHTAQYEFYERVEQAAKEKQRILKYLSRPQFSDHRHLGHKKIPKKRPPHKMRYCRECGIRH